MLTVYEVCCLGLRRRLIYVPVQTIYRPEITSARNCLDCFFILFTERKNPFTTAKTKQHENQYVKGTCILRSFLFFWNVKVQNTMQAFSNVHYSQQTPFSIKKKTLMKLVSHSILKMKVLHDAIDRRTFLSKWFHKDPLSSEEPFCFKSFFVVKEGSSDYKQVRKRWFFKEPLTEWFILWHRLKNRLKHLYY